MKYIVTSPMVVINRRRRIRVSALAFPKLFSTSIMKTLSRIPTPAGAPGIKKPATNEIDIAIIKENNET